MYITSYVFIFITNKVNVNDYNISVTKFEETPLHPVAYCSRSLFATKFKLLNAL